MKIKLDETHSPFQPALDDNAIFDESSQMMMLTNSDHQSTNDDQHMDDGSSRPDSNNVPAANVGGIKKLKIVLSSLAQQTNLTNKQNINNFNSHNVINDQNNTDASSNLESVNKLDSNSLVDLHKQVAATSADAEEVREDEKELLFEVKPHLRDFKFEKNSVPVKRGFENSGLCSIM